MKYATPKIAIIIGLTAYGAIKSGLAVTHLVSDLEFACGAEADQINVDPNKNFLLIGVESPTELSVDLERIERDMRIRLGSGTIYSVINLQNPHFPVVMYSNGPDDLVRSLTEMYNKSKVAPVVPELPRDARCGIVDNAIVFRSNDESKLKSIMLQFKDVKVRGVQLAMDEINSWSSYYSHSGLAIEEIFNPLGQYSQTLHFSA